MLISQIWALFKGYCDLCVDLQQAFTTPFARLVTNLLYTQPGLRTSILQGLRILVTTNQVLAGSGSTSPPSSDSLIEEVGAKDNVDIRGFGITPSQAQANVAFLRSIASNMVSVLFNVFSSASSEERGLVGEVIGIWLGVLNEKVRSWCSVASPGSTRSLVRFGNTSLGIPWTSLLFVLLG